MYTVYMYKVYIQYYIHCLYMDNIDMFKTVHIQWNTFYYEPLINNIISGPSTTYTVDAGC